MGEGCGTEHITLKTTYLAMLIKNDPDLIQSYLEDYSNIAGGYCDSVYLPKADEEVSAILQTASRDKLPITVSGAGTGVTGARIPFGGSVLSLEKMNKILEIRGLADGGEAVLESGVMLEDLLSRVESEGFFYPPNPTEKSSFIGGNVSTSASGARSFLFGTTRDYILGLTVVLSSGGLIELERGKVFSDAKGAMRLPLASGGEIDLTIPTYKMPKTKNAAGYFVQEGMDAIDLFIGQEGTLGVITKVKVRLLKGLKGLLNCYAFFNSQEDALRFIYKARETSLQNRKSSNGLNAISLEFFNAGSLSLLRQRHSSIPVNSKAAVFFEQEISKETESGITDAWARLIEEAGGSLDETWFAQTKQEQDELAKVRHDLPDMVNEYIKRHGIVKVGTDIAVPHNKFPEMIACYDSILKESGLFYVIFGHIGDNHLHVNILPKDKKGLGTAKAIYERFVKKAIDFSGTVTAEHGIGKVKHEYLQMMYGRSGIEEMVNLKKRLDPACILGLDNIFPKRLLT